MAISSTFVSTSSRITVDGSATGVANMQRDIDNLHQVVDGKFRAVIRVYRFVPRCISLGRHQKDSQINLEACARDALDVVQRPTGGGAVLHAEDDLTYSLCCHEDDPIFGGDVEASCRQIHGVFAGLLAGLGIETQVAPRATDERAEARLRHAEVDCFARPARGELCLPDGRKILGSAQMRYANGLLQHGSLVLHPTSIKPYLGNGIANAESRIAGIGEQLPGDCDWDRLARLVADAFAGALNGGEHRYVLTP